MPRILQPPSALERSTSASQQPGRFREVAITEDAVAYPEDLSGTGSHVQNGHERLLFKPRVGKSS